MVQNVLKKQVPFQLQRSAFRVPMRVKNRTRLALFKRGAVPAPGGRGRHLVPFLRGAQLFFFRFSQSFLRVYSSIRILVSVQDLEIKFFVFLLELHYIYQFTRGELTDVLHGVILSGNRRTLRLYRSTSLSFRSVLMFSSYRF